MQSLNEAQDTPVFTLQKEWYVSQTPSKWVVDLLELSTCDLPPNTPMLIPGVNIAFCACKWSAKLESPNYTPEGVTLFHRNHFSAA